MAELFIYDDIGPSWLGMVGAKDFIAELNKIPASESVVVRINSPGGDVHEAMAIYNAMLRRGVDVEIDGIAASAASYIAMAGKTVKIAENGLFMIHRAMTFAYGNSMELGKIIEILNKHDEGIASVYAAKSGKSLEDVNAALDAETWYTAAEAVGFGLANEIGQPLNVAASIAPGRFKNTPEKLVGAIAAKSAKVDRQEARLGMYDARLKLARAR